MTRMYCVDVDVSELETSSHEGREKIRELMGILRGKREIVDFLPDGKSGDIRKICSPDEITISNLEFDLEESDFDIEKDKHEMKGEKVVEMIEEGRM